MSKNCLNKFQLIEVIHLQALVVLNTMAVVLTLLDVKSFLHCVAVMQSADNMEIAAQILIQFVKPFYLQVCQIQ